MSRLKQPDRRSPPSLALAGAGGERGARVRHARALTRTSCGWRMARLAPRLRVMTRARRPASHMGRPRRCARGRWLLPCLGLLALAGGCPVAEDDSGAAPSTITVLFQATKVRSATIRRSFSFSSRWWPGTRRASWRAGSPGAGSTRRTTGPGPCTCAPMCAGTMACRSPPTTSSSRSIS